MHWTSLIADIGRVIGLAVMLLMLGALVVGYADSLRRNRRNTDPAIDAQIRARMEELREGRR